MGSSAYYDAAAALVMPTLCGLSILVVAVAAERGWSLIGRLGEQRQARRLLKEAGQERQAAAPGTAGAKTKGRSRPRGAFERVYRSWRRSRFHRGTVEQSVTLEEGLLERNVWILECAASISPLVGILGTLVGISKSFGGFDGLAGLQPAVVSRGISLALRSTAAGLAIAIAALLLAHAFRKFAEHRTAAVEGFAETLLGIRER